MLAYLYGHGPYPGPSRMGGPTFVTFGALAVLMVGLLLGGIGME
jgi:hypothetical protein